MQGLPHGGGGGSLKRFAVTTVSVVRLFPALSTALTRIVYCRPSLSPDARQIATLMLGKLWIIKVDGSSRAIANVPFDANSIAWSPDEAEVTWSAGVPEQADLFATNLTTGVTRRITGLAGREANPVYSPDGRHLAFAYVQQNEATLRVVEASSSNVRDATQTGNLGSVNPESSSPPQWSPESDGRWSPARRLQTNTFVPLSGAPQTLKRFTDGPIFLQWTQQHTILFVRHDRLWQAPFDRTGMLADPQPIGNEAALYAPAARDGTLLFVSTGGLRLRSPKGEERSLGWPISYTPPLAEPMLIRNVRIVDGTGGPTTPVRDILIERGRINRIAPARSIPAGKARIIDAKGRIVMPGLMDLLPLVAAGMDAKEHIGSCEPRGDTYMYDDLIQLFRVADIGVVPTVTYFDFAVRLNERPALLDQDAELTPFLPSRDNFDWMLKLSSGDRQHWAKEAERARETTAKLWRAGITLGTGTDIWRIPIGVHMEVEQMVAAGLTPMRAIHAGTGGAARILGADKDLGTIEVGKWADLSCLGTVTCPVYP